MFASLEKIVNLKKKFTNLDKFTKFEKKSVD